MKLVWADIETSGLDEKRDRILEVAISTAEIEQPFDLTERFHAVVHYDPTPEEWRLLPSRVIEMHTQNGLWEECKKSTQTMHDVARALEQILPIVETYDNRPVLAGSSIDFDRKFLLNDGTPGLPYVMQRFHHRLYDVSSIKLFCRSLGMPKLPRAEAHRARDDIRESVAHAKACADWAMFSGGTWICHRTGVSGCGEMNGCGRDKCRSCGAQAPWLKHLAGLK